MPEENLNIEIELCGSRCKILRIFGKEATPLLHQDAQLYVYIEFDAPHPEAITGTSVTIPAKEYSREELLAIIIKEGEKQFSETLTRRRRENEEWRRREGAKKQVEDLAARMEEALKG
ncbi:hypothetical protein ES705_46183 [subsurface metagenome]